MYGVHIWDLCIQNHTEIYRSSMRRGLDIVKLFKYTECGSRVRMAVQRRSLVYSWIRLCGVGSGYSDGCPSSGYVHFMLVVDAWGGVMRLPVHAVVQAIVQAIS
jgi:hypothetical protein